MNNQQNPYNPFGYAPSYLAAMNMPQPPQPVTPASPINWVMGKEGAKAFPVAYGQSALLMDSEASRFYIKTVDDHGFASLTSYTFAAEETPQTTPPIDYATQADLHSLAQQLLEEIAALKEQLPTKKQQPQSLV